MKYEVKVEENTRGASVKIINEKGRMEGSLHLPMNGPYKYDGAFKSNEIEFCQNSLPMIENTSYVHNLYIEQKENGCIYRSNKRESMIALTPCNKLYLNGKLYYGYEICTVDKALIIPVYKNSDDKKRKYEEIQVGLIRLENSDRGIKTYSISAAKEDELAVVVMMLYEYLLSINKFESDYKITTDETLLAKHDLEFEQRLNVQEQEEEN